MKEKLLQLIEAGRAKEAEVFLPRVDDSPPRKPGEWTMKDTVAHLSSWRQEASGELESVRTGAPAPVVDDDDDVTNAGFYARTHQLSAQTILESAAQSWDALADAVRACTEEMLAAGRPMHPELQVWLVVPQNAIDHVADHLGYWYAQQGDPAAEEAAALWRYGTNVQAFSEDRRRGVEEYMLARFYATHDRRDEASSRLELALKLRPSLRQFAEEDPDLKKLLASKGGAAGRRRKPRGTRK